MSSGPDWVEPARALPLGFAQVREDAALDIEVLRRLGPKARVLMVASGGCTAAALAAVDDVALLHLVDPNPAQIALTRLKLELLRDQEPEARLAVLGHRAMPAKERAARLESTLAALGPAELLAQDGPDFAGRYERVFLGLARSLAPHRAAIESVLRLADPAEQARRVAPDTPLGTALDRALAANMSLPILVALFGEEATRNPVQPFAAHFAQQVRHALGTLPAADNPYLWQMLLGCFPDGRTSPWLAIPRRRKLPAIRSQRAFMIDALREAGETFDFVHLSNILDWLSHGAAAETLDAAGRVLRPGGCVFVRQLNSTLDIPALAPQFAWDREGAQRLLAADRSFFYRALHLGLKR